VLVHVYFNLILYHNQIQLLIILIESVSVWGWVPNSIINANMSMRVRLRLSPSVSLWVWL